MKTNTFLSSGILITLMVCSLMMSCKDEFTDQDLINAQSLDSVQLSIVVVNGSTSSILKTGKPSSSGGKSQATKATQGLGGLTVTLTGANGKIISRTTDANGLATFRAMEPGTVSGVVSGSNFTTTNFVVAIRNTSENDPFTIAGVIIPVFETSGPNTATITGTVTAELNLLNDTRENVPDGTTVSFSMYQASLTADDAALSVLTGVLGASLSSIALQNADVTSISFESNFTTTITGGKFSAILPTSPDGLTYEVAFSDFEANQSIAINNLENASAGSARDVRSIMALFTQNLTSGPSGSREVVPLISPIQFDIGAPPTPGSGAVVDARLIPQPIATSGFSVLKRGIGYTPSVTNIPVTVSGGDFDNTVPGATLANLTAVSNAAGQITGITGTLGFGYRSQATLTVGGTGSGSVVLINYASTVADPFNTGTTGGTTITSGGSGYFVAPNVLFRGFDFAGQAVEASANAEVVQNGALVDFTPTGATFARLTSTFIQPVNPLTATASSYSVNNNGAITSISIGTGGAGYNPASPPAITIRDLRAPGGSGAQGYASTTTSGTIDNLLVIVGGSGYTTTSLANFPSFFEPFSFALANDAGTLEDTKTVIVTRPGATRVLNAHYGTGRRSIGIE